MARQLRRSDERPAVGGLPRAMTPVAGLPLVIWVAFGAGWLRYAGAGWDVAWHRTIGRDTFWSPPHLALYAGVTIGLLAAVWALAEAALGEPAPGPRLRIGRFVLPVPYLVAFAGGAITILSAPFDDLWHFLYGRDVDIWSPPHLSAIFGSAVGTLGWTMALVAAAPRPGRRPAVLDLLYPLFFGFLLYTGWFSLNWYYMVSATRDATLYPVLVGLVMLPCFVAGQRAWPRRWSATGIATAFVLLAAAPIPFFDAIGWVAPAFPPLLVVPALAIDLLDRRLPREVGALGRMLAFGLAFGILFVTVELVRMWLVPPEVPSRGVYMPIVRPYLAEVAARPWTLSNIVRALPAVLVAHVVGAGFGWLLGAAFRLANEIEHRPFEAA